MASYAKVRQLESVLRLPLEGKLDLTYRCGNDCRHCWLHLPRGAREQMQELSFDEIRSFVLEAKGMGCRTWNISGGEPMLRPDFPEIYEFILSNSLSCSLNTNGTLITPHIARLMTGKGSKMVALYGATADVHDYVTRTPGSFEAMMRGLAYLKEAGVSFTVQVVPMRANYHQHSEMVELARSLSPRHRLGATWLYLSAYGDPERNEEIKRQRLTPKEVVSLDRPSIRDTEEDPDAPPIARAQNEGGLFQCASNSSEFHVDPYGGMSFCYFIKDPSLRYSLRNGSFTEGWDEFIPSLADKVQCDQELLENCGMCRIKPDCKWCSAYAYLEHGRYSAKIDYLCAMAAESREYRRNWRQNHRRYFRLMDIPIVVESDIPFSDDTFKPDLKPFEADGPGENEDAVVIRHHFGIPAASDDLGKMIFEGDPVAVFRKGDSYIYRMPGAVSRPIQQLATCNVSHTEVAVYHRTDDAFRAEGLRGLMDARNDQVLFARVLAGRGACYLHSSGVILDGSGLLFAGESEAGKTTMVKMLSKSAEVLCDERIIVAKRSEGFRICGTWNHGELACVSPSSAPLRGIFFLRKAQDSWLEPIENRREIVHRLLPRLVKPLETKDWWDQMLGLIDDIASCVPCYVLHFDKSGSVIQVLKDLVSGVSAGESAVGA